MSPSDCEATEPVTPLSVRLASMEPGASAPKMPCVMLVSALIGPQLVSPSTRMPTSIKGIDSTIATAVSQKGIPKL